MRMTSCLRPLVAALCLSWATPGLAQEDPFAGGWTLQAEGSVLGFQSVKNDTKVEMNAVATFAGSIAADGAAEVRVALDSIDTHIDLRNVRMRFLFFETFKFPEAVITAQIDPALLADLPAKRRILITLPVALTLHGVTQQITAPVAVTLISDDRVTVASVGIIPVAAADYDLAGGITRLQEAAKVKLVPVGSVSFDWVFARNGTSVQADAAASGAATALETQGTFDADACAVRFDTLSQAGNITFGSGLARLDVAGSAVLDTLLDVVTRCPDMRVEIGGHTDDVGTDATNLTLSDRRAAAVRAYLVGKGVAGDRLLAKGYGETFPLVPNDSAEARGLNRRTGFTVLP